MKQNLNPNYHPHHEGRLGPSFGPARTMPVSVLIAYDDFAAAAQAERICSHLLPASANRRHPMWKFSMLQDQKLNAMAALDAAAADMLVIAMNADGDLPEAVQGWVTRWLEQQVPPKRAVVVMNAQGPALG